jgi:hypothetical protein
MTRRSRSLLCAYALGLRHARAIMQKDLDKTRANLEREVASLRAAVRELQVERFRAQEICRVLETEHEPGIRLH